MVLLLLAGGGAADGAQGGPGTQATHQEVSSVRPEGSPPFHAQALAGLLASLTGRGVDGEGALAASRAAEGGQATGAHGTTSGLSANLSRAPMAELVEAYNGTLLHGPHAGFLSGVGRVWLQHVRKAGGTTLCAVLRQNLNASSNDCMLPTLDGAIVWSMGHGEGFYRTLAPWGAPFSSLAQLAAAMRAQGVEAVASESGGVPDYALPGKRTSAERQEWVFLTSMRAPLDRLVSAMRYEGKSYGRERRRHRRQGKPEPDVFYWALRYGAFKKDHAIYDCHLDNYATRVFSQQCGKESEVTLEDFERAARTVRSYDICIVTEWMAEMAPLLKVRI